MRLTLRTLLAYMDDILEPADREELAKKVESSEFAHDLIHRTKDTMRRLRLSAPQVVGTGIGLDPNTVAEYLDNVLPPDSVADFERICLESDVHLAEVASCHHVLTMVLGEPAEVEPAARQRMYSIPSEAERRKHIRVEPAHAAAGGGQEFGTVAPPSMSPAASLAGEALARQDAIPDYLRATAWTRHRVLLAACAAVLLLAVTALLTSGLTGWFGGQPQLAADTTSTTAGDIQPPDVPPLEPPAIPSPSASDGSATVDSEMAASPLAGAPPRLLLPEMSGATEAEATAPPVNTSADVPGYSETPPEPVDRYPVEDTNTHPAVPSANVAPAPALPAASIGPAPTDIAGATPSAEVVPDVGAEPAVVDLAAGSEAPEDSAEKTAELGTYLDSKNVLLRYDPSAGAWFRMASRSTLQAGDKVLALPAFYPKMTLASGLHLKLAGGTLITLGTGQGRAAEGAVDATAIDVAYGQVVMVNTANDEQRVRLTLGADTADVRLGQNATLAVEVVRSYVPGRDPRQSPWPVVAHLYARAGDVVWEDASGTYTIHSPGQWSIADGVSAAVTSDATFPDWIDQEPTEQRSEQLFGAPVVEQTLDPTRPVEDQLLELYQGSRRREVKSLVARSSVYAGLFVPFVEALRDSEQRSTWKMHIETLRQAMALGPESADRIWETLVEQRGQEAAHDLYEMLCGYGPDQIGSTPEQIKAGPVGRLIDWMEDDSLDYRVLAVQDMWEITGMRLMANPAGTPTERARGVRIWRQRLNAGEVRPVTP